MNSINQNIVISNHPFNSNDKNDIVSSSSPSPRSSRSSSPSKANSLNQNRNNQNLILMRPKSGQRSMSHSKTPSSRSNSISRSNSDTLSSNYSSRDSLYENSNNNNNNKKDKKIKTVKKNQRIQSRSRSRTRQNISNHNYNTNHMHNRMPIEKSIDQDQFKCREKPIRRESKSPDNLYEHQSSSVYPHSARHESDYHLEKNSSRSNNLQNKGLCNSKNYDNTYLKNEKLRRSSERNRDEYTRHHVSRESYHHHNSRPRSIEKRPSSRERTRNYNEEDERERYAGDYTSICLKNLNESLRVDDLREHIYNEFKNYRNFSVKVVNNRKGSGYGGSSHLSEKIAFVNFNNHQDAKHAKRTKSNKLFFGYQLHIEPVFRNRSSNEDFARSNSSSNYRNISPVTKRNYYRSPSPVHKQKFYSQRPKSPDFNVQKEKILANEGIKSRNTFYSQKSRSRSHTPNRLHSTKSSYHIKDNQPKNFNNEINGEQNILKDQHKEKLEARSPIQNQNQRQKEEPIKFESNNTVSRNQELFLDQNKPLLKISNSSILLNEEKMKNVLKGEIQDSNNHEKADIEVFREKSSMQNLEPKPSTLTSLQPINSLEKVPPLNITHSAKLSHSSNSSKSRSRSSSPNRLLKRKYMDNLIPKKIKRSPSFQSGSYSGNKQYGYEITNKSEHTRDEHRLRPSSPPPKSKERRNRSRSIEQNKKPYDDSSYKHGLTESKSKMNTSQYGGVSHYFDDDERDATRTLFIGNLDNQIDTKDLIRIFEKHGIVEEIDIKRNQPFLPSYQLNNSDYFMSSSISMTNRKTYAFIKYLNMDMAMEAKFHLNGKKIGRHHTECKIGYGKVQSTNCLWVGGLVEKSRKTDLENEFEYFANNTIQKSLKASAHEIYKKKLVEIDWRPGGHLYAYVLFPTISQAEEARFQMRGKRLPGSSSERLRIDYVDPKKFRQSYIHSRSSRPHTPLTPPPHEYLSHKRSRSSSIEKKRSLAKRTDHEISSRQIDEIKSNSHYLMENNNQHDHFRKFETSNQIDRNSKVKPFDLYPPETSFARSQFNSNATKRSLTRSESKSPVNFKQITNLGSDDNRRVIGLSSPPRKIIENYVPCEDQINTSNNKYNEDKPVTPLIESTSNLRLINKSKPSDSISLLSCSKLENIIITKTENTRLVNTVSDLLNTTQLDQFKTEIKLNASSTLTAELEMAEKKQTEYVTMHSIHLSDQKLTASCHDQNHLISHWNTDNKIQKESYSPSKEKKSINKNEIKNSTVETKSKEIDDSFPDYSSYEEPSLRSSQKEKYHRENDENWEHNEPESYESSSSNSNGQKRKQTDHNEEKISYKKSTTSLSYTLNSSKLINETQINKRLLNNNLKSIDLISTLIENSWSGIFTLKKHIFPTKFYLIGGSKEFAEQILPQQNQQQLSLHNCLRISQRLRLDESKLDELEKKLFEVNHHLNKADMHTFSVLVSVPSDQLNSQLADNQYHQRSLHNLISYLDQKNAAGVIPLPDDDKPNSMMHAFTPNCSLSNKLVNQLFPHIKRVVNANILANNDFIIIIIFKQNLNNNNINGKVSNANTI